MPQLWKYCLKQFFKILLLTLTGFIALMLVMRLSDIAKFAAQTSEWKAVGLFMLYQIPYILPLAMPVSALCAAFITMRGLCDRSEMTALRAGTLSISQIHTPIICAAVLLSSLNFWLASELNPYCRSKTRELAYSTTAHNPLALLKRSKRIKFKNTSIDLLPGDSGQSAKDLCFITYGSDRLSALLIKNLHVEDETLWMEQCSNLLSIPTEEGFDDFIIENQQKSSMRAEDVTLFLHKPSKPQSYDSLPWRLMRVKAEQDQGSKAQLNDFFFERVRRISYGLSPLTFSIMGLSFGLQIGRKQRKRAVVLLCALTALILASVLVGKSFETKPMYALLCYGLPHPIAWILAWRYKTLKERGVE